MALLAGAAGGCDDADGGSGLDGEFVQAEVFSGHGTFIQRYGAAGSSTLSEDGGAILAVDASRILFNSSREPTEYYSMDHLGGDLQLVLTADATVALQVVEDTLAAGFSLNPTTGFFDVVVADFSAGTWITVATTGSPSPTPIGMGGGKVAYFGTEGLHVVDTDGANDRGLDAAGVFEVWVSPDGAYVHAAGGVFDVASGALVEVEGGTLIGFGRETGRMYFETGEGVGSRAQDGTDTRVDLRVSSGFGSRIALSWDESAVAVDRDVADEPYRQFIVELATGESVEVAAAVSGPFPRRYFLP